MRLCTEIYKSCAETYINRIRENQCGDKDEDEDVAKEEDSQNQSRWE
jgi:hypothetical protein